MRRWGSVLFRDTTTIRATGSSTSNSGSDLAHPLLVGFPIGAFELDFGIVGGRLHPALGVDRARDECVLARRGFLPVVAPECPGVSGPFPVVQFHRSPVAIVN